MEKDSFPARDSELCVDFLNLKPQAPQAFSFLKEMYPQSEHCILKKYIKNGVTSRKINDYGFLGLL